MQYRINLWNLLLQDLSRIKRELEICRENKTIPVIIKIMESIMECKVSFKV